jgi:5-methylcytosine-specific restriction enzyme subunit McrC
VYPGSELLKTMGKSLDPVSSNEIDKECSIFSIPAQTDIKQWQKNIREEFEAWMG